jgi:uncharacterized repeat protein (TIGR03803 family)
MHRIAHWACGFLLLLAGGAHAQSYFALAQQVFSSSEGTQPQAVAVAPDGAIYGISEGGGANGYGSLFRYLPNGGITDLHDFNGSDGSMRVPICCTENALANILTAPSGDVYGYTYTGGNSNCQSGFGCGVIFHYSPSAGFSVLWKFTGGADGSAPSGLVLGADGNLYGSSYGLPDDYGAVFRLSPKGVMHVLHSFCSSPNCADGIYPDGLTQAANGKLYGHYYGFSAPDYIYSMTLSGVITPLVSLLPALGNNWGSGAGNFVAGNDGGIYFTFFRDNYGSGRVDRYDISTNRLTLLHQFDYTDGYPPYRMVNGSDGSIYGTTASGGSQNAGTVFRVTTPSTLSFLYDFQGMLDGSTPTDIVQTADGLLFGVAAGGGIGSTCSGCGTLYQLAAVPAAAPITTTFNPASGPAGTTVAVSGSQFTGTVSLQFGGVAGSFAVLGDQSLNADVPGGIPDLAQLAITNAAGTGYTFEPFQLSDYQFSTLYGFCSGTAYPDCGDGAGPTNLIQSSDGNFYGTASYNFPSSVLFKVTPTGTESVLAGGLNIPNAIVESGGYFYGTSQNGGYYGLKTGCNGGENPEGCGTIFRVSRSSGQLTILYDFKGLADGAFPQGNLVSMSGGALFGTTSGTLFMFSSLGLQTVHSFNAGVDGSNPAMLLAGQDGNVYGANTQGGAANQGTVFEYSPATSSFQVLHSFAAGEGSAPAWLARTANGTLYGVTRAGGANNQGSIFRIDSGGSFTTLYSFSTTGPLGVSPGHLVLGKDGALYGYTGAGAILGGGAVFRIQADGSDGTAIYSFFPSGTASTHGYGPTSLLQGANGDWYGTTSSGGAVSCAYGQGCGEVFHIH